MSSDVNRPGRIARGCVLVAVVVAPWLFGAGDTWAYMVLCLLIYIGAIFWLFRVLGSQETHIRAAGTTVVLLAVAVLAVFQILPLPSGFVRQISPVAAEAQREARALVRTAGVSEFVPAGVSVSAHSQTLSASPGAGRHSLYLVAAAIAVFVVTANCFHRWHELRWAVSVLVGSSFIMAVLGIIHEFSGNTAVLWLHEPHFGGSVFGPFANPNHYALHMNMALGAALGLLLAAVRRAKLRESRSWRELLGMASTRSGGRVVLLAFAIAVMGGSVCISLSRGGIVSLMGAIGGLSILLWMSGDNRRYGSIAAGACALVLAMVVWLGWEAVTSELGTLVEVDPIRDGRTVAAGATLDIFRKTPVLGTGFGTFQYVFPSFQPASLPHRWLYAHNDYVQLLAEGGLVAGLALGAAVFLYGQYVRVRWKRTRRRGQLLALGLLMGLGAAAVHSAIGFGLHMPANLFLFAALAGFCVAAVHVKDRSDIGDSSSNRGKGVKR